MKRLSADAPRGARHRPRRKKSGLRALSERAGAVLRALLPDMGFRIEEDTLLKGLLCAFLILFLALLQTTAFARFRLFGAIPDLMLPLVVAIAMREGERWGAVCGLAAAVVIQSLGASGPALLPLLYVPAGYFCPIITRLYLTDSAAVRLIYTAVCGVGRAIVTLFCLALTVDSFSLPQLLSGVIVPEYASTFVMSVPVHLAVRLLFRPFHKPRSERVETL